MKNKFLSGCKVFIIPSCLLTFPQLIFFFSFNLKKFFHGVPLLMQQIMAFYWGICFKIVDLKLNFCFLLWNGVAGSDA